MSFFDSTFFIDLLREQRRSVTGRAHKKLQQLGNSPVRLSVFVVCEIEAGVALSQDPEERHRVRAFVNSSKWCTPTNALRRFTGKSFPS